MDIDKIIREELNKELGEDVFTFGELTPDEKDDAYNIFKSSYEKTTGKSWDKAKFYQRASNWKFFGVKSKGFIVIKPQASGLNKVSGVAGDIKAVSLGLQELSMVNEPLWGMADKKMVDLLVKRYNYISPPAFIVKLILKMIPKGVLAQAPYTINDDGSVTIDYEDVGQATKYFFANKLYFKKLYPMLADKMTGIPWVMRTAIKKFFDLIS